MSYHDKDVDLLVRSHQISRARISKGLSPWAGELKIKGLLKEDLDDQVQIVNAARSIAEVCKASLPAYLDVTSKKYDRDLDGAIEILQDVGAEDYDDTDELLDAVNYAIRDIYDFCDLNRFWVC